MAPGSDRVAEDPQECREVGRQAIHTDEDDQGGCTGAHLLHQRGDQVLVALRAEHPTQPQMAREGQRYRQPGALPNQLDPQLIGLDVLQVHLSRLDQVLVHLLAVLPGPLQPGGHGCAHPAGRCGRDQGRGSAARGLTGTAGHPA